MDLSHENPRNRGEMESPDSLGRVVGAVCGDEVTVYIKVSEGIIQEMRFTTYGCWAAIAMGSLISEIIKGRNLEEALNMNGRQLAEETASLPEDKVMCAELVVEALHKAVRACLPNQEQTE